MCGITSTEGTQLHTTEHLPALVLEQGGALVWVMSDIDNYIDGRELTDINQLAIARLIELNPALNERKRVEKLVYLFTHFGLSASFEVRSLIERYSIEIVFVAVAFVYEITAVDIVALEEADLDPSEANRFEWRLIVEICELIAILEAMQVDVSTAESLAAFIMFLGGLSKVVGLPEENVHQLYMRAVRSQDPTFGELLPEELDDKDLFETPDGEGEEGEEA